MAEALAPIDESVAVPAAVKAAAAKAESYYQSPPTQPESTSEPPATEAAPVQPLEPVVLASAPSTAAVEFTAPAISENSEIEQLREELAKRERDYNALLGRNAQQREYIAMQQGQLAALSNPRSWAQPESKTRPLITDEERKAYGDEALSVMERKAREVVEPIVEHVNKQNEQLRQELQRVKSNDVYAELDRSMPAWRAINALDVWKEWLRLPDLYSGMVRQQLLNQAFAAGDAGRVLAFFRGFGTEYPEHVGQLSPATSTAPPSTKTPVRKATIRLENLAAPGRASPSPPSAATEAAPPITNRDVSQFYRDIQRGVYTGREEQKLLREREIHAAVREGRVQIVK